MIMLKVGRYSLRSLTPIFKYKTRQVICIRSHISYLFFFFFFLPNLSQTPVSAMVMFVLGRVTNVVSGVAVNQRTHLFQHDVLHQQFYILLFVNSTVMFSCLQAHLTSCQHSSALSTSWWWKCCLLYIGAHVNQLGRSYRGCWRSTAGWQSATIVSASVLHSSRHNKHANIRHHPIQALITTTL